MKDWRSIVENIGAVPRKIWQATRWKVYSAAIAVIILAGLTGVGLRWYLDDVCQAWYQQGYDTGVGNLDKTHALGWLEGYRYGIDVFTEIGRQRGWRDGYQVGVFAESDPLHKVALQIEAQHPWVDVLFFTIETTTVDSAEEWAYFHIVVQLPYRIVAEDDLFAFGDTLWALLQELHTAETHLLLAFAMQHPSDPEGGIWVTEAFSYPLETLFASSFNDPENNGIESVLYVPVPLGEEYQVWPSNPYSDD